MATAGLLPILLGLFGFYAVSNAIALDRRSGAGPLFGASPVRSSEYLLGKLLGSFTLLSAVTLAFSVVVMAVQVVHGEAPLEPLVFLAHVFVVALPALLAVASFALLFECVPVLSGRFGDVAYFFVWVVTLSMPLFLGDLDHGLLPAYAAAFDWNGFGFLITEIQHVTGRARFRSAGGARLRRERPSSFPGFDFSAAMVGKRALAFLPPLALLPAALAAFDRFDPARRLASASTKVSLLARFSALFRPVAARLLEVAVPAERSATRPGLLSAAVTDLLVTCGCARSSSSVFPWQRSPRSSSLPRRPPRSSPLVRTSRASPGRLGTREERTGLARVFAASPGAGGRIAAVKLLSAAATALSCSLRSPPRLRWRTRSPFRLRWPERSSRRPWRSRSGRQPALRSPSSVSSSPSGRRRERQGKDCGARPRGFQRGCHAGSITGWLAVAAVLATCALLLERFRLSRA